jgi:hypothetical protein
MSSWRPATSDAARTPGSAEAILAVVTQLTELVRSESEAIASRHARVSHSDYNLKKSQALLVMNRFAPLLTQAHPHPMLRTSLLNLCGELETNRRLLQLHLRAAQAVSDLITRAIREGQSDGTYSPSPWRDDAT